MSNKPLVIANWKMKLGPEDSHELAHDIADADTKNAQVVLCPSFPSLLPVQEAIHGTSIALAAQDCFWERRGAYTGEVSVDDLVALGCQYVIVGHSERREHLGETNEQIHKKIRIALEAGLTPIVCVGETFDQRTSGARDYVLIEQVTTALQGIMLNTKEHVIVAYEPVWVIGSGQAIDAPQAADAHRLIYQTVLDVLGETVASKNLRIVYGGSVDADNVASFLSLEHTSGVLVGSASLTAESLLAIVKAC